MGYHTGFQVAAEATRQRPEQTGRIVMISAPIFSPNELKQMQETYGYIPLDIEGATFLKMWKNVVYHHGLGKDMESMAMSFTEHVRIS